VNDTMIISVLS